MKIQDSWWGKRVKIIDIDDQVFNGQIVTITDKGDNDETGRDSIDLYDGKNYIFFSDNEIKSIEVLD